MLGGCGHWCSIWQIGLNFSRHSNRSFYPGFATRRQRHVFVFIAWLNPRKFCLSTRHHFRKWCHCMAPCLTLDTSRNSTMPRPSLQLTWTKCRLTSRSTTMLSRKIHLMPLVLVSPAQPFFVLAEIVPRCSINNTHFHLTPKSILSIPQLYWLTCQTKQNLSFTQTICNRNIILSEIAELT